MHLLTAGVPFLFLVMGLFKMTSLVYIFASVWDFGGRLGLEDSLK